MLEWLKQNPVAIEKLILEFYPMQSQRMQKALHKIHNQNHRHRDQKKHHKSENYYHKSHKNIFTSSYEIQKQHFQKDFGKLAVCKTQRS